MYRDTGVMASGCLPCGQLLPVSALVFVPPTRTQQRESPNSHLRQKYFCIDVRRGILFWREMLLNMMKVFDTISFVRALRTKGRTKGDMTKTVNKHVKCRQHFSPEKDSPSYELTLR